MKRIAIYLLVLLSFTFTGCIQIIEEVFLNKDGSGQFTFTMDLSGLIQNPMLKEMIKGEMGDDELAEESFPEVDSVLYFKDAPDSLKMKFSDNEEFLEKVKMRMKMSEEKGEMVIAFDVDFEELKDIDYFFENLGKLSEDSGGLDGLIPMANSKIKMFDLNGRTFSRLETSDQSAMDGMQGEDLEMAKMMLGDAKYITIYHMPGKVKKVSNSNSEIGEDKKTVTTTINFVEMMEGKAEMENTIKFKKK